jgi:hypothetical protein
MGIIEIDMFSEDVDSPEHAVAESFKERLEDVAEQYECHLTHFDVQHGIVSFSFDDDELTAKILKILRTGQGDIPKNSE